MLFTYCSYRLSVCSSLSTCSLKSKSASRIEDVMLSFLLLNS